MQRIILYLQQFSAKWLAALKRYFCLLGLLCLLSSCQFHLRQAASIPPTLDKVYLQTARPNDPLLIDLRGLLKGLHVQLVSTQQQAPMTLSIKDIRFYHDQPSMRTSTEAVTFTYTFEVLATLMHSSDQHVIVERHFITQKQVILNSDQVYIQGDTLLIRQSLQREVLSLLYYWLRSDEMHHLLAAI